MTGAQTGNGKAFEYAIAEALQFATCAPIDFDEPAAMRAKVAFFAQPKTQQGFLRNAAAHAIARITAAEGNLTKTALFIQFHSDSEGEDGFVEDITLVCEDRNVAISCKYNHDDAKHPRLSDTDFATAWGMRDETKRSTAYQNKVAPVFGQVRTIMTKRPGTPWNTIGNKVDGFYVPVLNAFAGTVRDLHARDPKRTARELHNFCIGRNDFYKVRLNPSQGSILVQAFNMNGTLAPVIPVTSIPTGILAIRNSDTNLAAKIVTFDNGTALKFRIHNGDGIVRAPDLKLSVSIHGSMDHLYSSVDYIPVPSKGDAFLF